MSNPSIAVFPAPPPPDLARTLDLAGYAWKPMSDEFEILRAEPDELMHHEGSEPLPRAPRPHDADRSSTHALPRRPRLALGRGRLRTGS